MQILAYFRCQPRMLIRSLSLAIALATASPVFAAKWGEACPPRLSKFTESLPINHTRAALDTMYSGLRQAFPHMLADQTGKAAGLKDNWKPGNKWYDKSVAEYEQYLKDYEAKYGPLTAPDWISAAIKVCQGLTEADMKALEQGQKEAASQLMIRSFDTQSAITLSEQMLNDPELGKYWTPQTRQALEQEKLAAGQEDQTLKTEAGKLGKKLPSRTERFMKVVNGLNKDLGQTVGQATLQRSMNQFKQAVTMAPPDKIKTNIEGFKSEQEPARPPQRSK